MDFKCILPAAIPVPITLMELALILGCRLLEELPDA
ncbi:MAG: hypothetical protein RL308_2835 [Bacteroidota bacterium]|jgi:hypothetical protein